MSTPDNQVKASQLIAETMKLNAATIKMQRKSWWYPFVIITAAVAFGVGLAKIFM